MRSSRQRGRSRRPPEFVWVEAPAAPNAQLQHMRLAAVEPALVPPARKPIHTSPLPPAQRDPPQSDAPQGSAPWTPSDDAPPLTAITAAAPPEGCGLPLIGERHPLSPGDFGPDARIRATARWSSVEAGSAVRVYAAMTDPEGVPLVTDLTAFGSQSRYRVGCIRSHESRYRLFTSVVQVGERLTVMASVKQGARWVASGSLDLTSGQSGVLTLSDGREVSVVALARPETAEEQASEQREGIGRRFVDVLRVPLDI
jgi:hypothetical protein